MCAGSLASGGKLIVNQIMIDRSVKRDDISVIFIPCNEIDEELGNKKLLSMVAVGALLTALPGITLANVQKSLEGHLPMNYKALRRGFEAASKVLA
jgi:2-oxoglutarate ferredoxin oxidoreductase subunit gamma